MFGATTATVLEAVGLDRGSFATVFANNTYGEYILALSGAVVVFIVLWLVERVVLVRLRALSRQTENDFDDTVIAAVASVHSSFLAYLALYVGLLVLVLPAWLDRLLDGILLVWVVVQAVQATGVLTTYGITRFANREGTAGAGTVTFLSRVIKIVLWVIGAILVLQNFGVNVSSLLAGLGIGGIAIALAAQQVLGDLFSSFAIYFDKPFVVGDVIRIGKHIGTVEKIGIKTTRVRSVEGEEIIVSNQELTTASIQNYGRVNERRVDLRFGVTYDTSNKKLEQIPEIVETIVSGVSSVRFGRAHFATFGDSALEFVGVYFVESDNYQDYMDAQQTVNLALKERFGKEKIEMAFPTQTIHLEK